MRNLISTAMFVSILSISVHAQQAGTGNFTVPDRAVMPEGRVAHCSAESGGNVYVWSGSTYNALNQLVNAHSTSRYSPTTDTWITLPGITPPTGYAWIGFANMCGTSFNGNLYQFAGTVRRPTGTPVPTIGTEWMYSVAANAWSPIAAMPEWLTLTRAAATSDRIYVMGGNDVNGEISAANYEFDPSANTWTSRAPIPNGVYQHYIGAIDGKIYITGGYSYDVDGNLWATLATREYNPANNTWTDKAPMLPCETDVIGRANGGFAVAFQRLYVFGGIQDFLFGGSSFFQYQGPWTIEYSAASNTWIQRPNNSYNQGLAAATATRNGTSHIYLTGGSSARTSCREFNPPDYGMPPDAPTGIFMQIPGGTLISEGGYVKGAVVEFGGTISDPNIDQVQLEVEVVPDGQPFVGVVTAASAQLAEGLVTVEQPGLVEGDYKWRCRARDWNGNVSPWVEYGTPARDFTVDQTAPSSIQGIAPNLEVYVKSRHGGPVDFSWVAATDNLPTLITYEIQVSGSPTFGNLVATTSVTTASTSISLIPNKAPNVAYYWRVRAFDAAGNHSVAWSTPRQFMVIFDDQVDHGAGDGVKVCGFSAPGTGSLAGLFVVIAILAAVRRR